MILVLVLLMFATVFAAAVSIRLLLDLIFAILHFISSCVEEALRLLIAGVIWVARLAWSRLRRRHEPLRPVNDNGGF